MFSSPNEASKNAALGNFVPLSYLYLRTAVLKYLLLAVYLDHSSVSCDIMEFEYRNKFLIRLYIFFKII